jgi:hypothetical protein
MVNKQDNDKSDDFDLSAIIQRISTRKPVALGSLSPFICFLSNSLRAIRYNKERQIPCDQFIRGLECRWGRPVDSASVFWFRHHEIAVDLLHQILCGQLTSGNPELDGNVTSVLIDGAFWYTPGLGREVLESENAFGDILNAFSKYFPDAATVIMYAENTYWKSNS